MDVVHLLPHHRLALDELRVAALPPHLMLAVVPIRPLVVSEEIEKRTPAALPERLDNTSSREGLECLQFPRQVGRPATKRKWMSVGSWIR